MKNWRKLKIQKNLKKLIPKLPFGIGFIRIHQLARFLQQFEFWWFPDFGANFPNFNKDLYWILGQNPENLKIWCHVRSYNFCSRADIKVSVSTFFKLSFKLKVWRKKIEKKLMYAKVHSFWNYSRFGIFRLFRKSGSGPCSKCCKTC